MPGGLVNGAGNAGSLKRGPARRGPGNTGRACKQQAHGERFDALVSASESALMRRCLLITSTHHEVCDERCSVRSDWGNREFERLEREQRSLGFRWTPMDSLRRFRLLIRAGRLGGVRSGKALETRLEAISRRRT